MIPSNVVMSEDVMSSCKAIGSVGKREKGSDNDIEFNGVIIYTDENTWTIVIKYIQQCTK